MPTTSDSPLATASAEPPGSPAPELLQSVVEVARAAFGARACSVLLLDEEAGELVFRAVCGPGEDFLPGRRIPADSGIAGWVTMSGEPMVVDDLTTHLGFDRAFAESTAYVPNALMAAPLVQGDRVLGVLEVLDPSPGIRTGTQDFDLLLLFAHQAATTLRTAASGSPREALLDPGRREDALRLLSTLEQLLR